ncbi:Uma2 family endonuclease [Pleurocapsa sp. PCC 7319]|uniref:Uma2 family endonuclease n=1 Tax=Pleurocapsa sp. PCC 7319 TaxID=118161 RepID=UPI00036E5673|nr:Uma2 family endonuclease [Pleurocapsa sp. PCC 7319]
MLIDDQLPINKNYLLKQDRTLSFSGMTWDDYEKFNAVEYLGYRTSFLDGVITLMSPSQNHEMIKDFIFLLVITYCDAFDLDYYPTGSTTLKNQNKQVGKEPDTSFCFNNLKKVPDLAVEVVFSSGGTYDLNKYQKLGVQEVWFWINNTLEIYVLNNGVYQQQQYSFNLSKIENKLLTKYIAKALTGNPRILKKSFLDEIK